LVAAALHRGRDVGEIYVIAVDPAPGVGGRHGLTGVATGWLRRSGLLVAVIEAGGPGHAPARRVCEEAGCTALPAVRFFRAL
jgi:hypothetical protein